MSFQSGCSSVTSDLTSVNYTIPYGFMVREATMCPSPQLFGAIILQGRYTYMYAVAQELSPDPVIV